MKELNFSANSLKSYENCPKQFYLRYIKGIRYPVLNNNTDAGSTLHLLINYFLKGFDIEKFLKTLPENQLNLFNNFKNLSVLQNEVIAVEKAFSVKIFEKWLDGRFDAVFKYDRRDGEIIIADWKTGKLSENIFEEFQTLIYLLAAKELYKTENISLIYFSLSKNSQKVINFDDKRLNFTRISEIITNIEREKDFPADITNCKFCEFKTSLNCERFSY